MAEVIFLVIVAICIVALFAIEGNRAKELSKLENQSGSGASDPMAITDQFHISVIMDMINAVIFDKTPFISIDQGRKPVELINSIYKSKGNRIKIIKT